MKASLILRSRKGLVVLAVVVLAVLGALAVVLSNGKPADTTAAPQAVSSQTQPESDPVPVGEVAGLAKSEPVSIDIPKIKAHSSLIPLGLNADNTVEVPSVNQPLQA